jgi:hypothetical protein
MTQLTVSLTEATIIQPGVNIMQRFVLVSLSALSLLAMAAPSVVALNERFERARWENLNSFNLI